MSGAGPEPPTTPGQTGRHTHDSFRLGTASPFAAPDVAAGDIIDECRRHRGQEFLAFLPLTEKTADIPGGTEVHLVPDDDSTRKTPAVRRRPAWVGRSFAEAGDRRIRRGVLGSVPDLAACRTWQRAGPGAIDPRDPQRPRRVASSCERINGTGH